MEDKCSWAFAAQAVSVTIDVTDNKPNYLHTRTFLYGSSHLTQLRTNVVIVTGKHLMPGCPACDAPQCVRTSAWAVAPMRSRCRSRPALDRPVGSRARHGRELAHRAANQRLRPLGTEPPMESLYLLVPPLGRPRIPDRLGVLARPAFRAVRRPRAPRARRHRRRRPSRQVKAMRAQGPGMPCRARRLNRRRPAPAGSDQSASVRRMPDRPASRRRRARRVPLSHYPRP